jgi:hypothetical protein
MPPRRRVVEVSVKPMEPAELDRLTRWIDAGAPPAPPAPDAAGTPDPLVSDADRQFWSFQPPKAAEPPAVVHADRVRNAVDAFLLARLEAKGLSLSAEADRRTLLRRATFDLTGLPPTPEEAAAFLADPDPVAYEKLVDRLLDSPRYGERWARYWLDLAGYSDSEGIQNSDPVRPWAWRYRDYVIRSLNDDKPYDRFLLEQLAGDELADYEGASPITPEMADNLIATGFLRMVPDGTFASITGFVPDRMEVINAEMEVLGSAVLGLSIRCARCHSHKFDPIPQRDYYRLLAVFKGAYDEHDWLKPNEGGQGSLSAFEVRQLPFVATEERTAWAARCQELDAEAAAVRDRLAGQLAERSAAAVETRIAALPAPLHDDVRRMLATPAAERDAVLAWLAEKFEAELSIDREKLAALDAEFKAAAEAADKRLAELAAQRPPEPMIRALWDRGAPSPTYVLRRGDYLLPGEPVEPGVPSVLGDGRTTLAVAPPWPGARQTGRRLAFARWLARPDHPLTARVLVNRVWRHHFGAGLVATLDNFGRAGAAPTHPELLDWLAVEFVRQGWSLKRLHRLLMTSSAYRQESRVSPEAAALDPANALLSRMPLVRLDAEPLRDTLLAVAGRLDLTPFGPADGVEQGPDGVVNVAGTEHGWRRSVYAMQRRTLPISLLETFDLPRMSPNCVVRPVSTVAPQALYLMNNGHVRELAAAFARRVAAESGDAPADRIERAFWIAFSRPPTAEEREAASATLAELTVQWQGRLATDPAAAGAGPQDAAQLALASFCHALVNAAEFVYVD